MSQPPPDQPADRHPGYGPNPPPAPEGAAHYPPQGQPGYPSYQAPGQAASAAPGSASAPPPYQPQPYQPQPYQPQYGAPTGYPPQQQPHPGYGQPPPAGAAPRHPGYGPNPPGAPGRPTATGPGAGTRSPLGLAALVLGAIGPILGFLFLFIQAAVFANGGSGAFAAVSITQSVLVGLTALAAVILGLVAISKPGSPKAFASAGIALGAASLLGVLGSLIYPVIFSAMY